MPKERITITTIYTFDELEDSAKERAREIVGTWNQEWENDCLPDMFAEYLEEQLLLACREIRRCFVVITTS